MLQTIFNIPVDPGPEIKAYIKENYYLSEDGKVWSRLKKKEIGSKSNGCKTHDGYSRIKCCRKFFKRSHISFFLFHDRWPELALDHINDDKTNDAPWNLQEITEEDNQKKRNKKLGLKYNQV